MILYLLTPPLLYENKRTLSQSDSSKKKEMEIAGKTSADMLDCVIKKWSEHSDQFEQLERERIKQEDERAKCESAKNDKFMALFT